MATHLRTLRFHRHCLLQRAAVIIFCCFALLACGKKDDPSVPHAIGPETVKQFRAFARSGGIILAWKPPTKNTDKTPLLDLESFKIYREEVAAADLQPGLVPVGPIPFVFAGRQADRLFHGSRAHRRLHGDLGDERGWVRRKKDR